MSHHHKPIHLAEKARSADSRALLVDKISFRAYELYQQRGGEDGHDIEDWLCAEKEISQDRNIRKAS